MNIIERIKNYKDSWFLILTGFFFFLLRLPSLFEPYWYGDEGIYQTLGLAINSGKLLYRDIWDNKPPLLYMLYASFGSDQFTIRLISLIFGLLSVFVFYLVSEKLFAQKKIVYTTTFLFALLFGLPLLEGNIANSENFMMLPILLASLLVYNVAEINNIAKLPSTISLHKLPTSTKNIVMAGFLLGLAFLFKIVAIFDFAAFFIFLSIVYFDKKRQFRAAIENLILFSLSFALPMILVLLFFLIKGGLFDFINAAFRQNVGYVGYGNTLLIPQGFILLKLFLLVFLSAFLFIKRHSLGNTRLFIFLWFAFSLFNAFFSGRPYTHYLLVLLASFILFFGLAIYDKKYQKITAPLFIIILILISTSFNFFGKTINYYQNYISFLFFNKSVSDYQSFFDRSTPRDYALASFIKTHTNKNDSIFIWGNNAQVYALTNKIPPGRYTVMYHMLASKQSLEETQLALDKVKPKYIIISPEKLPIPLILPDYQKRIMLYDSLIYERIF